MFSTDQERGIARFDMMLCEIFAEAIISPPFIREGGLTADTGNCFRVFFSGLG